MHAVIAIALSRKTGAPEYFLVRTLSSTNPSPQIDATVPPVVYSSAELVEFLDTYGLAFAFAFGVTHSLRVTYGTHGHRFIESFEGRVATNTLKSLPQFAFVNEASPSDVMRLLAIDGLQFEDIKKLEPDLIIGTNAGLTQEDYTELSKIAPTIAPTIIDSTAASVRSRPLTPPPCGAGGGSLFV